MSWASFPCQDLSLAGSLGGIHASRSGLVWEWLRVLDEMTEQPKMLVLENVIGLLSTNKGENYSVLHHALTERDYRCGAIVINASHFVPQSRPRVFIIAVKKAVKYRKIWWVPVRAGFTIKRLLNWESAYQTGFGGTRINHRVVIKQ